MTVTLGSVDVSQSTVDYHRKARVGSLPVPNRYGDVRQAFGSESYEVKITGVWTPNYTPANDPRSIVWGYQKNNTPVQLILTAPDAIEDLNGRNFLLIDFNPQLVQGIPSSIIINYTIDLVEAV